MLKKALVAAAILTIPTTALAHHGLVQPSLLLWISVAIAGRMIAYT